MDPSDALDAVLAALAAGDPALADAVLAGLAPDGPSGGAGDIAPTDPHP